MALAYGAGEWLAAQNRFVPAGPGTSASTVALRSNGTSWAASPAQGIAGNTFSAAAYGNGGWLAAMRPAPGSSATVDVLASTTFFSSPDAKVWTAGTLTAHAVQALAFGPAPESDALPAPAPETSPGSTKAPQPAETAGSSLPASPAGAATNQPGASAAGLCSPETVLAVVNAGRPSDQQLSVSPANIHCAGQWIAAGVDDTVNGAQYTVVLQRVNGTWTKVDRQKACGSGAIPAGLSQLACNSN